MTEDRPRQAAAAFEGLEDLEVLQRAYRLSPAVHRASLGFPEVEQRAPADQIRRASKSICANLAEGAGRQGAQPAEFRRFVMLALGSSDEMRVWARYCRDLGDIDEATWRSWRQDHHEISKMLQGLWKASRQRS